MCNFTLVTILNHPSYCAYGGSNIEDTEDAAYHPSGFSSSEFEVLCDKCSCNHHHHHISPSATTVLLCTLNYFNSSLCHRYTAWHKDFGSEVIWEVRVDKRNCIRYKSIDLGKAMKLIIKNRWFLGKYQNIPSYGGLHFLHIPALRGNHLGFKTRLIHFT